MLILCHSYFITTVFHISALVSDLILVLGLIQRTPLMFMPGIIIQMMLIIILIIDSTVLYIGKWSQLDMVYNGLIPGKVHTRRSLADFIHGLLVDHRGIKKNILQIIC